MSDDKTKRGKPDRDRINVHEPYELDYWSKELGITKDQLKDVVRVTGPMVVHVRNYINQNLKR